MADARREDNLTGAVLAQLQAPNPRLQRVVTSLVTHLHAFIRDVEPSEDEWLLGIDLLTRTGHMCDDRRQEFMLLSDTLGVTALVEAINHRDEGVTASTVTGPFRAAAPAMDNGAIIARGPEWERGEWALVRGRVADAGGRPLPGARVEVWQADDAGHYDVQDERQPPMNLRGVFTSDAEGRYWFRTVKPCSYPVPVDGPAGELLLVTGRQPMRPAHIHLAVTAPGYRRLITHLFVAGDPYLATDPVFGVADDALVVPFVRNESRELADRYGLPGPFYDVAFDVRLAEA